MKETLVFGLFQSGLLCACPNSFPSTLFHHLVVIFTLHAAHSDPAVGARKQSKRVGRAITRYTPGMMKTQQYRAPFPPGRSEPCFCESGRRFKHCCGSSDPMRPVPHGIEILENFLSPDECREWVRFAATRPSGRLTVIDWKAPDPSVAEKLDDRRVTERVHMGDDRDQQLRDLVERIYVSTIASRLGRKFAWFESPQILKYNVGGFYQAHADADSYDTELRRWRHHLDRDISLLLYLNDEFDGGDLQFEYFNFRIQPKPGMLVWFPSDARYFHRANPVEAGTRYAVVSWAALADTIKVGDGLPNQAVLLDPQFLPASMPPPGTR